MIDILQYCTGSVKVRVIIECPRVPVIEIGEVGVPLQFDIECWYVNGVFEIRCGTVVDITMNNQEI